MIRKFLIRSLFFIPFVLLPGMLWAQAGEVGFGPSFPPVPSLSGTVDSPPEGENAAPASGEEGAHVQEIRTEVDVSEAEITAPAAGEEAEEALGLRTKADIPETGSAAPEGEEEAVEVLNPGTEAGVSDADNTSGPGTTDLRQTLKDMGARVTDTEIRMDLSGDILFDTNRYGVQPDAREALGKVAAVIRAYPGKTVMVEGHTDFEGSQAYNRELSLKRAESVRRWLRDGEGLTEPVFQIRGWGKVRPRASNRTEEGRQKNRRVEITILTGH